MTLASLPEHVGMPLRVASIALLALACCCPMAQAQACVRVGPVIGIDHVPLAVRDLGAASATYRQFGFALKPGRLHANGIGNSNVKFPDGSGIELITASRAIDDLATQYVNLLAKGEGPAFIAFHARNTAALVGALSAAKLDFTETDGTVMLADPSLRYIFFVRDNRSPTDELANFAHPNGATAMTRVWIADSDSSRLQRLLEAVGGVAYEKIVHVPNRATAKVVTVDNGEIILLPPSHRLVGDRPVVGVSFRVDSVQTIARRLGAIGVPMISRSMLSESRAIFIPPSAAHGIWLEFREGG
jgi:catechol 2,3-dioxygenase-like lactoylglutathione lyase family enzyme